MNQSAGKIRGIVTFICATLFAANIAAHTLPISYLTVVPDANYVHLELTLNPFELNGLSEFDADKNQKLDLSEIEAADKKLTDRILQQLKLKADGEVLRAETAGLSGDADTHHLTLRAHYRVPNAQAALSIESDLSAITSSSHLTEVTFGTGDQRQLARLDSQTSKAVFSTPSEKRAVDEERGDRQPKASTPFFVVLLLAALPITGLLIALLKFVPKLVREEQVQH